MHPAAIQVSLMRMLMAAPTRRVQLHLMLIASF